MIILNSANDFSFVGVLYAFLAIGIVAFINIGWPYLMSKRSKFKFIDELLQLAAHVMKADGSVSTKEKMFVSAFLTKEFGVDKSLAYMKRIDVLLGRNYQIQRILKLIDYNESEHSKIALLNFLIKITIVDSYLSTKEHNVLIQICKGLGLRSARLTSMLSMYDFTTESAHKKSQSSSKKKISKTNSLSQAYSILELNSNATEKDIKKSYRKLVVLYHPDKIMHMSPHMKKGAKEMFQKVNDAYDLIKLTRGFK